MKPTPIQQYVLGKMAEGGGQLRHPDFNWRVSKTILISTIKAMLSKGLITEESRYVCAQGTCDGQETEAWRIKYKPCGGKVGEA